MSAWVNQGFPQSKLHLPQGFGVEFLHPSPSTLATIREFMERESRQ